MTLKTKIILSAALVALLSAPASARFDGDEDGRSAYPLLGKERSQMTQTWDGHFVNRPATRR